MPGTPRARTARPPRLHVDPIACKAHGLCADLLPELIHLDEWGYPLLDPCPIPDSLLLPAGRAVAACPTLALRLRSLAPTTAATRNGRR